MATILDVIQAVGVFITGLVGRLGVFLLMLAVLVAPALLVALAIRAAGERRRRRLGLRRVAGLLFRPDAAYAPGHTWLHARRGGALALGLDDLALRLVTGVTAVELPRPGTTVEKGDPIAALHAGGRVVRIPAPIAGTIAGVNAAVVRDPSLVKRDGYGRGWLVAIRPADASWRSLPSAAEAESFLGNEAARFHRFLEDRLGFAAADGGELVSPAPWLVGEEGWRALTDAFLAA